MQVIIFGDEQELKSKIPSEFEVTILPKEAAEYVESFQTGLFSDMHVVLSEDDIKGLSVVSKTCDDIEHADQIAADIIWFDPMALYAGRPYRIVHDGQEITINITEIKHGIDQKSQDKISIKYLEKGNVAACNLSFGQAIDVKVGSLVLIYDRKEDRVIGAAACKFALYRSSNIKLQHMDIDKAARSKQMKQKPVVLWFTGLSGSGKSTIANQIEQQLYKMGRHCYTLDGDNVRHGLNRDLGFSDADRIENIRRIGEVAKLMVDAGLLTLVSFISPFRSERAQARSILEEREFVEIYIDTPLEVCQDRDVKGLYKKALAGEIKNFTGISSPYEPPLNPEITLKTTEYTPEQLTEQVLSYLQDRGII
ncbi:MAG: adenylyl-sulfate kinase [Alphaproteobacteria bacterium]